MGNFQKKNVNLSLKSFKFAENLASEKAHLTTLPLKTVHFFEKMGFLLREYY